MMNKLEQARCYESEKKEESISAPRPVYHVTPKVGWMNDPNGFSVYKGEGHLFFQYYPYDVHWGPMHWAHVKTKDFIRWERLPVALAPDQDYETGCFSGSAIELEDGKQLLLYTSHYEDEHIRKESQSIAIGDGINYTKVKNNPVIQPEMLPEEFSKADFRDPKIWREEDGFYAVAASMSSKRSGSVVLLYSKDGLQWQYVTVLDSSHEKIGKMWECPDFFSMEGRQILIVSPMDMFAQGLEYHNGHGVVYITGEYSKSDHVFTRKQVHALEYGLDFYAPQTLKTEDGRRIMIGWMQSWENYMTPEGFGWSGMMTVPRELVLKDDRIYQMPVREIENYYADHVTCRDVSLNAGEKKTFDGISGRVIDMTVTVREGDYRRFTIRLAEQEQVHTDIIFDSEEHTVTFSRRYSGLADILDSRSFFVADRKKAVTFRILLDRYSVELFVNGGEQTCTSLIYTDQSIEGISFEADGTLVMDIEKHRIAVD